MLFMAYKYAPPVGQGDESAKAFEAAVLANANRGGENVATGFLMGALWGASIGFSSLPASLLDGLASTQRRALDEEVDAFLAASPLVQQAMDGCGADEKSGL